MNIQKKSALKGEFHIPGDKSISHRSIMLGSIAKGCTEITNFLPGADCLATIDCFKALGIAIQWEKETVHIEGKGLYGLTAPHRTLNVGNSGTTARLLSGLLCGQNFSSTIAGDDSLNTRPMERIMVPLTSMGASIQSMHDNNCAPLLITPHTLKGIHYQSPIASAQVKSALLFAGLYAKGITSVTEPYVSRNHSELMLAHFGAHITTKEQTAILTPGNSLMGQKVHIPGDISSAAYPLVAGLLVPNSQLLLKHVGINPTRSGILKVCEAMGGNISYLNESVDNGEPTADLLVSTSNLYGTTIEGDLIPTLIDEIPIIAIMAACAQGTTIIKDAKELKVKECDRIMAITTNLKAMGVNVTPTEDGLIIQGGNTLTGAVLESFLDHRIAMAFAIAGLVADGETTILGSECVDVSYPGFFETTLFKY